MSKLSELLPLTVDGLILSPPLVPPVLDGTKTVTRRMSRKWLKRKVGDLLFVRENWRLQAWGPQAMIVYVRYEADGVVSRKLKVPDPAWFERERARAKAARVRDESRPSPLRPSILLPRWASRCALRITETPRLERVQDITEEESVREGMTLPPADAPQCPCESDVDDPGPSHLPHCLWRQPHVDPHEAGPHVAAFVCTWTELHTKPGERWTDNPEVVRIAFERAA